MSEILLWILLAFVAWIAVRLNFEKIGSMKVNDKLNILVAEPWDFSSSDGDNHFICTILDTCETEYGIIYLARTSSSFSLNNVQVNFIVLEERNKKHKHYNIYYISENNINDFCNSPIHQNTEFIMIGSIKNIKRSGILRFSV